LIRVTVDTNTLASAAVARRGAVATLAEAWRRGAIEIAISSHILIELERALRKPYFAARLSDYDRQVFLSLLLDSATVVEIDEPIPTVLSDDGDNLVLATALSAKASHIVSGDRELQLLSGFHGIKILSARVFVQEVGLSIEGDR
jgi:putative PIN family toxin of toxin-antitoxin system